VGERVQQEQEEQEQHRTQVSVVQAPLLAEGTPVPDETSEGSSAPTAAAPAEPVPVEPQKREKPEPLDTLF
jgi:hypothetical protein